MADIEIKVLEFLQSISIFKCFSYEQVQQIMQLGELRRFAEGSYLMIENEPSRGLFLIVDGIVSVLKKDNETNDLHRLTTLDVGESIGEFSLFDTAPRSATVQAECLTKTYYLSAEKFESFLNSAPADTQIQFYRQCSLELVARFRVLNQDYVHAQQLLWKHALRKSNMP